jgi:acetyltransferase-like isoleucine patch superfamily enzyme
MSATREIEKPHLVDEVFRPSGSAAQRYQALFVGRSGLWALCRFEFAMWVASDTPGAAGYLLRSWLYRGLVGGAGRGGVLWGRRVSLRHPGKMILGGRVAVDDNCLLDARGAGAEGIRIGDDVLIARETIIQAKNGPITIGPRCTIGSQCQLSSVSGITLGASVMVAGQCYIGGGRYHTEQPGLAIQDQGLYSRGPVVIEDDVWIGAGAVIQDGVRIGRGSVIGAGALVREDVPAMTIVAPHQKLVLLPRGSA